MRVYPQHQHHHPNHLLQMLLYLQRENNVHLFDYLAFSYLKKKKNGNIQLLEFKTIFKTTKEEEKKKKKTVIYPQVFLLLSHEMAWREREGK